MFGLSCRLVAHLYMLGASVVLVADVVAVVASAVIVAAVAVAAGLGFRVEVAITECLVLPSEP